MYKDDELLPISALQHIIFCERRAALIYIEKLWDENVLTAEGRAIHEQVHEADIESRGNIHIVRGLWLKSARLGLFGKADIVEFHRASRAGDMKADKDSMDAWYPLPVEYKHGRLRSERSYAVQLCAQALCLEEMLGIPLERGVLYYAEPRRRLEIVFDRDLRNETEAAAVHLHELVMTGTTPKAQRQAKCRFCSLSDLCLPTAMSSRHSASNYLKRMITEQNETPA